MELDHAHIAKIALVPSELNGRVPAALDQVVMKLLGKTTLIQELYKPPARQRGCFINGKFDQLERNIPYQAFRRLVQRWLSEGEERLNTWRVEIETVLGEMAASSPRYCPRSISST